MLWLLLFLTTSIALAWHRAGLRTTTAAYAALLLAYGVFGGSLGLFGLALLVFAGVFVPLSLPTLRQEWLTRPLLDRVQRDLLPARALRLQQAQLDSQDAAAERRLYAEGSRLLPPAASGARADIGELLAALQAAAAQPAASAIAALASRRALAPSLPTAHGGLELAARDRARLLRGLAGFPGGSALAALIADYDSAAQIVLQHGSEAQQAALLPRLADGSLRLALALESRWSSGATSPDRGLVCRGLWKGRETLGLLLDFDKTDVAAATSASEFLVTVHVSDPERLLARPGAVPAAHTVAAASTLAPAGAALVRVPASVPGLQLRAATAGAPAQLAASGLFVPLDHLIGGTAGIGLAAAAQATALGARIAAQMAIASGSAAAELSAAIVQARIAAFYRLPESTTAAPQQALAEAALDLYALDTLQHLLARLIDAAQASPRIAVLAADAGAGLADTARRQLRPLRPGSAATPAIASGELAVDELVWSLQPPLHGVLQAAATLPYAVALMQFDAALWPLLGEVFAHQAHAGLLAISNGRIAGSDVGGRALQQLQRYRAALACCADALMLARDPIASGDAASALREAYAQTLVLAAVLQAQADGRPRDEQILLDACCRRSGRRIEAALERYIQSQNSRRRRVWLRLLLLPLGTLPGTAANERTAPLAALLLSPGPVRTRLLRALPGSDDQARLEATLDAAQPAQQRLLAKQASGELKPGFPLEQIAEATGLRIIDAAEADLLRGAYNLSEDWRQR